MNKLYCRFCAEHKGPEKLLNLDLEPRKLCEIKHKISSFNIRFSTYMINQNIVPQTICFVCCEALDKAWDFVDRYQKAQVVLSSIYVKNNESKQSASDDEAGDFFDDPPPLEPYDEDDQPLSTLESTCKKNSTSKKLAKQEEIPPFDHSLSLIKSEPNDETTNSGYNDESLNVQTLLDAAIRDVTIDSNVTLYAKEVQDLPKKGIKRWEDYPWLCQHCNIMFPSIDSLRKHSKEQHKRCFAFTCIDCDVKNVDITGNSFKNFLAHVASHRKTLQNICPYCEINYKNQPDHIQSHFKDPKVGCDLCGELFRSEKSQKKHVQDYVLIKPQRKIVKRRGQPLTEADLTCDVCNKVYKNLNSLRDHKKRHTGGERKRDYTCENCGKTYFTKGSLTSHIMMSHQNLRPHECRICKRSFLFPNMLRRHVLMHSSVKPFSCEQCGRCFRNNSQLSSHRIIHTDSMPHVCKYCGKAFRFKPILQTHERQHTGARPYKCKECGLEFTNWSNYNKHMKRRHGMTTAKKRITPNGVFPIDPETGKMIQLDVEGCEEWKQSLMAPVKWGRKKVTVLDEKAASGTVS